MDALIFFVRRYATAAWRRRWYALFMSWAISVGGWAAVSTIPNQYESTARVNIEADAVLTPLLQGISLSSSVNSVLDLLRRTILSRPNIKKIIAKIPELDMQARTATDRDKLINRLAQQIHLVPQTDNLFTVSYRDKSPTMANKVVSTVLTLFIENATGYNRSEMDNAHRFLKVQITTYEKKLRDAERRRAEFDTKYIGLLPGQNGTLSRLDQVRQSIVDLNGQLLDTEARRSMVRKQLAVTNPMLVTEQDMVNAYGPGGAQVTQASPLESARQKLAELRLRYTDQDPDVIEMRREIDMLRKQPQPKAQATRQRSIANPIYERLTAQQLDLSASIASIRRKIGVATTERDALTAIAHNEPELQAKATNLDRDYTVLRRNYEELLARREAMRITAAASADTDKMHLTIVDPPTFPHTPVSPARKKLVILVLFAGLGAGGGLSFVLAYLDRGFYTIDDAASLGLPVLGSFSAATNGRRIRLNFGHAIFGAGLAMLAIVTITLAKSSFWLLHLT